MTARPKELGISQQDMAALLKNRDGKPLSSSYFNHLERDRGKPPGRWKKMKGVARVQLRDGRIELHRYEAGHRQ